MSLNEKLRKLAVDNEKRTKTARLNDIFDDVEFALENGISQKLIVDLLVENGFEISMRTFELTLARLRKKRKNTPAITVLEKQDIFSREKINVIEKTVPATENEKSTPKQRAERKANAFFEEQQNDMNNNPFLKNLK